MTLGPLDFVYCPSRDAAADLARRLRELRQLGLQLRLALGEQPVGVLVHLARVGPRW